MHILCTGLNHGSSPIELREQLSLNEEGVRTALARLTCGHEPRQMREVLILSTCNRIEIYAVSSSLAYAELETYLSDVSHIVLERFQPFMERASDQAAIQHLFRVAAGLESLVIGEPQILGQVTRALELARGQNTAGPILNRLFQAAIHAGKRAHTETAISRNPASVSSLAAAVAERTFPSLEAAHITVLGAGEMAELTVEAMRKRGAQKISVVNRTLERAQVLARRWAAEATTFESLEDSLKETDIVIASTAAPHFLITPQIVERAMRARPERPLVMIDIALPRDIDPDCRLVPQVRLFNMDSLNEKLEHSLTERLAQVPQVNRILEEETASFAEFLQNMDVLPLIAGIRQNAEAIRRAEVEKTLRRLPNLTDVERERIEAMSHALVKKLLETPTYQLRQEAACPHAPEYAAVVRKLFGLAHLEQNTRPAGEPHPTSLASACD